mmetsp:Transcript_18110/g.39059  ORF Transcript_18110/g.39059 Transcript_18110/m.39059 type:complete len:741 (-) Transcript_18110:68-2290(-)
MRNLYGNYLRFLAAALSFGYARGGTLPDHVSDQEWSDFVLLNQLRTQGYECPGGVYFDPNPTPLVFDCRLWAAAHLHCEDMAEHALFSHTSFNGRSVRDRGFEQGIAIDGENIAAILPTAADVLDGFKSSEFHCQNIMDPSFTVFGTGYFYSPTSEHIYYWTLTFSRGLNASEEPIQTWCYDVSTTAATTIPTTPAATPAATTTTTTAASAAATTAQVTQGSYIQLQGTLTLEVIGSAETLENITETIRPSVVSVLADYLGDNARSVEVQLLTSKIQTVTSEDGSRRLRTRRLQHSSTVVTVLFTSDLPASTVTAVAEELNEVSLFDLSSKLMIQLASVGITNFQVEAASLTAEVGGDVDTDVDTNAAESIQVSESSEPMLSSGAAFAIGLGAAFIIVVLAAAMLMRRRGWGRRSGSMSNGAAAESADPQTQAAPPVMDCLACTFEKDHPDEPHGLEHSFQSTCKHFGAARPSAAASSTSLAPALPTLISKRSVASKDQAPQKDSGEKPGAAARSGTAASEELGNYFGPPYDVPHSPFAGERESLGESDTSSSAPPSETDTTGLGTDALSQNRLNLAIAARLATRHGTSFRSKSAWSTSRSLLQKQLSGESGHSPETSARGDCRTARSACGSIPEHEAVQDSLWEQQQQQQQLYREQKEILRRLPTGSQDMNTDEGQALTVWPPQVWEASHSDSGAAGVGTVVPQSARTVHSVNSVASGAAAGTFCGVPTCGPLAKRAMV